MKGGQNWIFGSQEACEEVIAVDPRVKEWEPELTEVKMEKKGYMIVKNKTKQKNIWR